MNSKLNLVLLIVFGLFLAALLSRNAALAWMSLPFLFYLGAGLLASPGGVRLRAIREISQVRCETDTPITMTVTVENDGPASCLRITEEARPNVHVIDGALERWVTLPAGESTALCYTFRAPRGQYRWEQARVAVSDPFGLYEQMLAFPAAAELRVLPEQLPIRRLRLRPRQTLRAAGPNLSRLPGPGIDFFGVREYHAGDSLRLIHWRKTARHPSMFFSKDFEREEVADIGIIVDGSAAAHRTNGKDDLFEYSVQAAAALAKNLLRVGNRLSLLTLGDRMMRVFPGTGKRQLVRVLDVLAGCLPGEKISLNTLKYLPVRLFPSHSLIIIISPLRAGDFSAIARLRASGYRVLVVSPNPVQFSGQGGRHPLAVRAAQLERSVLLWRMREIGVQVIDWSVTQSLLSATDAFLWAQR